MDIGVGQLIVWFIRVGPRITKVQSYVHQCQMSDTNLPLLLCTIHMALDT